MSLKVNIITNINNGYGLQRDYEIVKSLLENAGHEVNGVQYDRPVEIRPAELNIFLETIIPVFTYARENWYFPNPEWFTPQADDHNLPYFKYVLCKTMDCHRLFQPRIPSARFIGFESIDSYSSNFKMDKKFLHVAGQSVVKNTDVIIDAWNRYDLPYELTIIGSRHKHFSNIKSQKIKHLNRVDDEEFIKILNTHWFHLCPSQYEGWGHCFHEARSVGAIVITTDAPPMNEYFLPRRCLVPSHVEMRMRLANLNRIKIEDLVETIQWAANLPDKYLTLLSAGIRSRYLMDSKTFRGRFNDLVADADRRLNPCKN